MKVEQIMTRKVITVTSATPLHEAARLMVEHAISGLPVVDGSGRLVGVLSEGDLIMRQRRRERLPWWRLFFEDGERLARDYQKAVGTTVGEVMTSAVISVSPDLPVESAATILDQHRVRRLPVVLEGRLVGVVSRGDLIKALAATLVPSGTPASDAALVSAMRGRLAEEAWVSGHGIVVQAKDGILAVWGIVTTEAEKSAIETMARAVPGAKGVDSHLIVQAEIPYSYGVV
jgi:CBS domain-containing protein